MDEDDIFWTARDGVISNLMAGGMTAEIKAMHFAFDLAFVIPLFIQLNATSLTHLKDFSCRGLTVGISNEDQRMMF